MARLLVVAGAPLAAIMLTAWPALAKNSANLATQQDVRSITVQNWSTTELSHGRVDTTDGRHWTIKGVSRDEGAEVIVPGHDCIADVHVTLRNGKTLQLVGLHDCKDTEIVVRNSGITIPVQAIPGAKQHNTPG